MVSQHARDSLPMLLISAKEVVEYGTINVLGCYFPFSLNRGEYKAALEVIGNEIQRRFPKSYVVGGHCNAHTIAWGFPITNTRSRLT